MNTVPIKAVRALAPPFWDVVESGGGPATRIEPSIDRLPDVPGTPLSGLAGVYASRGWLAAMERLTPGGAHYVVAAEGGRVLGVLPVYLLDPAAAGHYHPRLAFGLPDEVDGPIAVLGGRAGYTSGWMLDGEPAAWSAVVAALLASAAELARGLGADLISAQYLTAPDAALLARTGLVRPGEVIAHSALAAIELPGAGFGHYVASLSAGRRSMVRRDLARFAASGLRLGACRLSEALDYAPRLLASVAAKHGGTPDVDRMRGALLEQVAELDEISTVVFAAPPDGEPVAYSLSYAYGDTLFVRLAGLDHARAEAAAAYFITTYYEPIRLAYRLGLPRVQIGIASYRPKVLRGAALSPLYGVLRGRGGAPLAADRRAAVQAWLLRALQEDLGGLAPPDSLFAAIGASPASGHGSPAWDETRGA